MAVQETLRTEPKATPQHTVGFSWILLEAVLEVFRRPIAPSVKSVVGELI